MEWLKTRSARQKVVAAAAIVLIGVLASGFTVYRLNSDDVACPDARATITTTTDEIDRLAESMAIELQPRHQLGDCYELHLPELGFDAETKLVVYLPDGEKPNTVTAEFVFKNQLLLRELEDLYQGLGAEAERQYVLAVLRELRDGGAELDELVWLRTVLETVADRDYEIGTHLILD